MPFGSFLDERGAVYNAARIIKEGGVDAVKIEGGTLVVCIYLFIYSLVIYWYFVDIIRQIMFVLLFEVE